MQQHENFKSHKNCVLNLKLRANLFGRINNKIVIQMDTEVKYRKDFLIRVVAVVKSLCLRELSFRGAKDKFRSLHGGNLIMSLELIAEFDPFLT